MSTAGPSNRPIPGGHHPLLDSFENGRRRGLSIPHHQLASFLVKPPQIIAPVGCFDGLPSRPGIRPGSICDLALALDPQIDRVASLGNQVPDTQTLVHLRFPAGLAVEVKGLVGVNERSACPTLFLADSKVCACSLAEEQTRTCGISRVVKTHLMVQTSPLLVYYSINSAIPEPSFTSSKISLNLLFLMSLEVRGKGQGGLGAADRPAVSGDSRLFVTLS